MINQLGGMQPYTVEVNDAKLGQIKIRKWSQLHFRNSSSVSLNLILVERIDLNKKGSIQKPLWLVFIGQQMPALETIWKKYLRRFAVDHWYRL